MAASSSGGLDPRFPEAYQRAGDDAGVAQRPAEVPRVPVLDDGIALGGAPVTGRMRSGSAIDGEPGVTERKHVELIVAGNPWLRGLWIVGALTTGLGLVLTVGAQYAFALFTSISSYYNPVDYLLPQIASVLAPPLVTAGVIALVAAACLRIVAWRPSGARVLDKE